MLDKVVRSNVVICILVSSTVIPLVVFWGYRYVTVLKPKRQAFEQKQKEDLLSEGRAPGA